MTDFTNGLKYRLRIEGELHNFTVDIDDDAPGFHQPGLTTEQLTIVRDALLAPHPELPLRNCSGKPSGILDVTFTENVDGALHMELTVDPPLFVGEQTWAEALEETREENEERFAAIDDEDEGEETPEHEREARKREETLTTEDVALNNDLGEAYLDEVTTIVRKALGNDFDFKAHDLSLLGPITDAPQEEAA